MIKVNGSAYVSPFQISEIYTEDEYVFVTMSNGHRYTADCDLNAMVQRTREKMKDMLL